MRSHRYLGHRGHDDLLAAPVVSLEADLDRATLELAARVEDGHAEGEEALDHAVALALLLQRARNLQQLQAACLDREALREIVQAHPTARARTAHDGDDTFGPK